MKSSSIEAITNAASWCEVILQEVTETSETAALFEACRKVSQEARQLEEKYSKE